MNLSRYIFTFLALSFILAFTHKAFTKEIPFYITCDTSTNCPQKDPVLDIACEGPFLRTSFPGPQPVFGAKRAKFYSAQESLFSPYGEWICCTFPHQTDPNRLLWARPCTMFKQQLPQLDLVDLKTFTLYESAFAVDLTMTKDSLSVKTEGLIEWIQDESSNGINAKAARITAKATRITAKAALGDDDDQPKHERDIWNFKGTGGDTVLVTLKEDPASGHIGEEATLILREGADKGRSRILHEGADNWRSRTLREREDNGRSTVIEINTGALPIEIMATLPSDGEYELVVEQHGIPDEAKFRGHYYLSLESASGEIQEIRPTHNVEQ